MDWVEQRIGEAKSVLDRLLSAPRLSFDETLHSRLPDSKGLYAIHVEDEPAGQILRAGRTDTGLRQRVYKNHLMGDQAGNLRAQLVKEGACADLVEAKAWIQRNCRVQFVVVEDEEHRKWAEHFMLAILRPKHCG
jgi:hypothetical protein